MPTQSYPYPDHEHPQYVTLAHLEAFEGRMINRISEMELRLVGKINGMGWRLVGLILPIYALVIAGIIGMVAFGFNVMGTQATILSKLP
jgi:hypothetical protein